MPTVKENTPQPTQTPEISYIYMSPDIVEIPPFYLATDSGFVEISHPVYVGRRKTGDDRSR